MKRFALILNRAVPVLILFTALILFSVPGLMKIRFSTDISDYFMDDDPVLRSQDRFERLFGTHEFVAVLLESEDVFSRDSLETINRIGVALKEGVPFAGDLVSLAAVNPVIAGGESFRFDGDTLVSSEEERLRLKESFGKIGSMAGSLFSKDGREAWIVLNLNEYPDAEEWSGEQTPQFTAGEVAYRIIEEIDVPAGISITGTGLPVYAHRKEVEMLGDFMMILVVGVFVSAILTTLILQNLNAIFGTFLVIAGAVVSVFGMYGRLGMELDNAFMAVPILLTMGLTIGYTVHITHFFSHYLGESGNRQAAVLRALDKTWRPILFTVITTSAAVLTFVFVEIEPIRWVGYTSAICLFVVYILSMTIFPVILSLGKNGDRIMVREKKKKDFEPLLGRLSDLVLGHEKLILLSFVLIALIAVWGASLLRVDFNAEKMMGLKLSHMQDQRRVGLSQIGSTEFIDLTIHLEEEGAFRSLEALNRISALQKDLETLPLVIRSSSMIGNVKEFNRIFHKGRSAAVVPEKEGELRALFNLAGRLAPELLSEWGTEDYRNTRIRIELSGFSSRVIEDNLEHIDAMVKSRFGEVEYFLSGSTYQMALMNQYVTRGLVRSILTGLVIITVLMILVFRSFRLGLIAMIPNVFPMIICGAVMGFARIPLEFVTMTVAPLIMGLAVDDTIHFISYMKFGIHDKNDYRIGIRHSFQVVGSAITQTTIILCVTFLVFTVSRVNSLIYMGILCFAGMTAAYMADIFITPLLVSRFRPFRLENQENS